ncbi:carbohydrate-binding protein [Labilibacter marinus]|uniref:carbohydrate-binding protein n=1 Tax=Labilibacter marinus TaxID=1477105 RepID=UPI0008303EDD|nr:carbohydrate-binding protein [Labilibacter marinus]
MKKISTLGIAMIVMIVATPLFSQTNVTISPKVQRYVGGVSSLDRSKFFTIHSTGDDAQHTALYNDYDVYKGRGFWGAFSYAKSKTGSVGSYPAYKTGGTAVRGVSDGIQTEHPSSIFADGIDKTKAANWAVEYYKDYVADGDCPEFFEPMNEPFVHASDFYSGGWNASEENRIKLQMAQLYGAIGQKIQAAPELANMKVVGYSSAWPSLELNNFAHWNENQKMFMDEAGAHMDAFAVHLYDGVNVSGQDNRRSGSNSEAILDLIETYSYAKWGTVKPHAITEYGAIEKGYGDNYSDIASVQTIKSINHILFNLLDRENKMAISIPFITGKAEWHITAANNYQPYQAVLWKPTNIGEPTPAGWEYTPRIHFYDLWKGVKGTRVGVNSDNADVQIQAFADGNILYVALNNLDDASQVVNLNMVDGLDDLQSVRKKSLKIYTSTMPSYSNTVSSTAPSSLNLIAGETVVLAYTFSSNLAFNNVIRSKKYYTSKHLQPIVANTANTFTFNNVTTGTGKASIRMTIGRKHTVSKQPVIKVNGATVAVPTNWKGYDQANRDDFFGTIEIPVSMDLINASNTITITFPDGGGHIASVVLHVEKYDTDVVTSQSPYPSVAHAIPGTIECENFDNGGEGVAYHDLTAANQGAKGRTAEAVDVETCAEGGLNVGWTAAGEWVEYTVNVASAGEYTLGLRYASSSATGKVYVAFDGLNKTGSLSLPSTGGWQSYQTVEKIVSLSAGEQVMRLYIENAGINLNHITLAKNADTDQFTFSNPITSVVSAQTLNFEVSYVADTQRDLVVEFWSAAGWLASTRTTVAAGSNTTSVAVNLSTAPTPGTGYVVKGSIRPVGGDWTSSINGGDQMSNITVTESNLLANPGFELGNLTSWASWGGVSVVSNNQNTGNHAVYVNGAGAPSQTVSVQPNATYTLVAQAKVGASGQMVSLGVKGHDAAESSTQLSTTTYSQVSHTFTTGANATTAQVYFYVANASHQAWGDDFRLYQGGLKSGSIALGLPETMKDVVLYPNPVRHHLYVKGIGGDELSVKVFSATGQLVKMDMLADNNALDMQDLPKGIYVVVISSNDEVIKKTIIKQ